MGRGFGLPSSRAALWLFTFAWGASCVSGGYAADAPPPPPQNPYGWLEEVDVGSEDHNAFLEKERPGGTSDIDGAVEIISRPLPFYSGSDAWALLLNPHAAIGSTFSFHGETSVFYATLLWRVPVWGPVFVQGEFGGAYNDSPDWHAPDRIDIGCPITFRESGGIGFKFNEHWDIVANVEHISHANLCGHNNPGLTNAGLKLGYKF